MISITLNERLPGADGFAQQLREIGLHATIPIASPGTVQSDIPESVSVGCSLPPDLVVAVLKAAFRQWPSLKYLRLTSDHKESFSESSHYQIRIGDDSAVEDASQAQAWTPEIIEQFDNQMSLTALHILLRTSYRRSVPATQVRYVGGPLDGEEHYYAGPPEELSPQVRTTMNAIYELRSSDQVYEYHYVAKKPI
jgi:hypothetical protein